MQLGRLHVDSGNSSRSKRRRMLNFNLRKTRIRTVDGREEKRVEEEEKEKEEEEGGKVEEEREEKEKKGRRRRK